MHGGAEQYPPANVGHALRPEEGPSSDAIYTYSGGGFSPFYVIVENALLTSSLNPCSHSVWPSFSVSNF